MLTLLTASSSIPLRCDDYYIRELPSGVDELQFQISIWDDAYINIREESGILEESDGQKRRYTVKGIDGGESSATVKALLDMDDWFGGMHLNYNSGASTPAAIINATKPSGWTVVDQSSITDTATVETPGANPAEILNLCMEAFPGLSYRIDNILKYITLYDLYNGPNIGAFTTREINLKSVQYKGKSNKLVTRLFPYGRDGLSIESVNSGLTYIDNHTYSDKTISAYWQSDNYTDAQKLYDAAVEHLKELAVPEQAYSCDIVDLEAIDPVKYSFLAFSMFSQVALIDETRSTGKIMHRVIERWRYPMYPEKNKIILSNAPKRITVQVQQALEPITSDRMAQGAVSRGKIRSSAVSETKIDDLAVTVNKIRDGAVQSAKIANNAVIEDKILNNAVSYAKLSGDLQVFYTNTLAAVAIFSGVIQNDGSVVTSSLTTNYLYVSGTQYASGSIQITDKNSEYTFSGGQLHYVDGDRTLHINTLVPQNNPD